MIEDISIQKKYKRNDILKGGLQLKVTYCKTLLVYGIKKQKHITRMKYDISLDLKPIIVDFCISVVIARQIIFKKNAGD